MVETVLESPEISIVNELRKKGISFEKGLNSQEFSDIEMTFNIVFPPDLKSFLTCGLPIGEGFINWRLGLTLPSEMEKILNQLAWPLEGILFDVRENNFWYSGWGVKPKENTIAEGIVREQFLGYPKLIPIYGHRYIPASPLEKNNPIFSVYQSDIIYYGFNLPQYFSQEFGCKTGEDMHQINHPKEIVFWSDCTRIDIS